MEARETAKICLSIYLSVEILKSAESVKEKKLKKTKKLEQPDFKNYIYFTFNYLQTHEYSCHWCLHM